MVPKHMIAGVGLDAGRGHKECILSYMAVVSTKSPDVRAASGAAGRSPFELDRLPCALTSAEILEFVSQLDAAGDPIRIGNPRDRCSVIESFLLRGSVPPEHGGVVLDAQRRAFAAGIDLEKVVAGDRRQLFHLGKGKDASDLARRQEERRDTSARLSPAENLLLQTFVCLQSSIGASRVGELLGTTERPNLLTSPEVSIWTIGEAETIELGHLYVMYRGIYEYLARTAANSSKLESGTADRIIEWSNRFHHTVLIVPGEFKPLQRCWYVTNETAVSVIAAANRQEAINTAHHQAVEQVLHHMFGWCHLPSLADGCARYFAHQVALPRHENFEFPELAGLWQSYSASDLKPGNNRLFLSRPVGSSTQHNPTFRFTDNLSARVLGWYLARTFGKEEGASILLDAHRAGSASDIEHPGFPGQPFISDGQLTRFVTTESSGTLQRIERLFLEACLIPAYNAHGRPFDSAIFEAGMTEMIDCVVQARKEGGPAAILRALRSAPSRN